MNVRKKSDCIKLIKSMDEVYIYTTIFKQETWIKISKKVAINMVLENMTFDFGLFYYIKDDSKLYFQDMAKSVYKEWQTKEKHDEN